MDMPTPYEVHVPDAAGSADVARDCSGVREMLSRVGDRWTLVVIIALREQPRRFNDLRREVGGISQQMLTRTVKLLERDGMLTRTVTPTTPPQVEYALTELGLSLSLSVKQVADWLAAHLPVIHTNRAKYDNKGRRS